MLNSFRYQSGFFIFFVLIHFQERFQIDAFVMKMRAFSNRCVCDENAQRISVDGRPKRIEMYAFSKEKRIGIEAASI